VNNDDLMRELLKAFEGEAAGLLSQASQALMDLESAAAEARPALYVKLGRALHTLKGSGATCGLMDCSELAHKLEDRLAPLKASSAVMPLEEGDLLLKGLDVLRERVKAHVKGEAGQLQNLSTAMPELYGLAPAAAAPPSPELAAAGPGPASAAPQEHPQRRAADHGDDGFAEASWKVNEEQVLGLLRDVERLREHQLGLRDRRRELLRAAEALREGDLELARTILGQADASLGHDAENAATVIELLEERLKAIHSLPASRLLEPLARAVRDACRVTGKQARLALLGGEVAADKRLLESLRGPLLHLVRNAVDHGIEAPQARDAAGKHQEGVITLRFEQQGNLLLVECSDDGGGVDPEKLRTAALKQGLRDAAQLKAMDEKTLLELIFESGFSSKDDVTQLSGRGVGLDVVRSQVRALRGSVELSSRVGQGTRFSLTLPLELGATPLMMTRVGAQVLGLPVAAVESVLSVGKATLSGGLQPRLDHRGQWLDLSDLGALLGQRPALQPEAGQSLLVLQHGGQRLALLVDGVDGDAELVLLPLPPELGLGVRNPYAGACLYLGAELVLALKPEWLLARAAEPVAAAASSRRALVVDDSLTARAMHRVALESGGFSVLAAASGAQALEVLAKTPVDVVVCDIQMEGMDGFALTRRLRQTSAGKRTPIVLVSMSESEEDRRLGSEAGADAFLSKKECAAGRLLDTVSGLLERSQR
jgi:chemotaxis protein histidine kinase CheA